MSTVLDNFTQSQLAFASYATLSAGTPSVASLTDERAGMSDAQAKKFSEDWRVVDQFTDPSGNGRMGSGLANCIKVPAEGFGESRGFSRAFLDTGEGMTGGRDIAPESAGERGQGRKESGRMDNFRS